MADSGLLVLLLTALGAAAAGGAIAVMLRQPLIVGYLVAGVAIGPFTPGLTSDTEGIGQIAELGVVFLMFVIGIQLPLKELIKASRVAIVGGLVQVGLLIAVGYAVGRLLGMSSLEAYALGAVVSNSSSTVLGKILSDRGELDSGHAQLGMAWSSVQDLSTVVLIAVLMALAPTDAAAGASAAPTSTWALAGQVAVFVFVLVPLAFFALPRVLRRVSEVRNREFFSLAVITVALGMAGIASLLGVSLALGAFLAGIVLGESDLAHRVLGDAIPVRDVFSAVFFVSIGMLLNPAFLVDAWWLVVVVVGLIIVVKGVLVTLLARGLGCSPRMAVLLGAGLAQSAEFSFLVARVAFEQRVVSGDVFNLLLTATIVSVLLAPFVSAGAPSVFRWLQGRKLGLEPAPPAGPAVERHAIVCGHGRVGRIVCGLLDEHQKPYVVVEEDVRVVDEVRARGGHAVFGDAGVPEVLDRAQVRSAWLVVLAIPERMATRRALDHVRRAGSAMVLARTHSDEDRQFLQARGADEAVVGEVELAFELGRRALARFGVDGDAVARSIAEARRLGGPDEG